MKTPDKSRVTAGHFRMLDGVWHKRCTGPMHGEPVYLPATEKYFHARKTVDSRHGHLLSRCRLCTNMTKILVPSRDTGLVDAHAVKHFYLEAANRVGLAELARRTGIRAETLHDVIVGRKRHVRKGNLKLVMLELTSIRRKKEYSIKKTAQWRAVIRSSGDKSRCAGCGTTRDNYTEGCKSCWERRSGREERSGDAEHDESSSRDANANSNGVVGRSGVRHLRQKQLRHGLPTGGG